MLIIWCVDRDKGKPDVVNARIWAQPLVGSGA